MSGPYTSLPTKRPLSETTPLHQIDLKRPAKRPKCFQHSETEFPSEFWNNLSHIDLTNRALNELSRRFLSTRIPEPRRPVTRFWLARLKIHQQSTDHLIRGATRASKRLKQFAKNGGPDLTGLRGYKKPVEPILHQMTSNRSKSRGRSRGSGSVSNRRASTSNTTTTSKSTGPYNRNFQQHLIDGGIFPSEYEYPDGTVPDKPVNWEEIKERLARRRRSLSPSRYSEEDFRRFRRADAQASKEKQVTASVIPILEGHILDAKCVSGGIPFTNLDPLTDGTIVPGNPDIYYGARPEQLDRRVREALSGKIIPSTQDDLPAVPNFFLAAKGPDGSIAVAGRQATYDGALGARGMHSLRTYGEEEPAFDNYASTLTSIYHGGQLKMFTIYLAKPLMSGGPPQIYTHQCDAWGLTGNVDTHRTGLAAYRNGREWTEEQRDQAIRRANERARHTFATTFVTASEINSSFESEATLDGTNLAEAHSQDLYPQLSEPSSSVAELQHHQRVSEPPTGISHNDADEPRSTYSTRSQLHRKKRQRSGGLPQ